MKATNTNIITQNKQYKRLRDNSYSRSSDNSRRSLQSSPTATYRAQQQQQQSCSAGEQRVSAESSSASSSSSHSATSFVDYFIGHNAK
jgi:hypothetical protein